jgi:hypothetical protein
MLSGILVPGRNAAQRRKVDSLRMTICELRLMV